MEPDQLRVAITGGDRGVGLGIAVDCASGFLTSLKLNGEWDALVHSAGNPPGGGLTETDDELWDRTMAIDVRCAFVLARESAPAKADWVRYKIPVGRLGEVADVVGVARFLLSAASGFVNGARIPCNGGLNATQADGPPL